MTNAYGRTKPTNPRKENNQRNPQNDDRGLGGIARESETNGHDTNQVFNSDSTWGNTSGAENNHRRQTTVGKILRQLRELQKTHLAYTNTYREQIKDLEELVSELANDDSTNE